LNYDEEILVLENGEKVATLSSDFVSGFLKKQDDNEFRRSIVLRIPDSIKKVVKPDF